MTTPLRKVIKRRGELPHRGRRLIVTLYPGDMIGLRPEKTRQEEVTSLAGVYDFAVKCRVAKEMWDKKQSRKVKRA